MIWKDVGMWHIEHINYLYHGTDARFNNISLDKAKAFKDFGEGFYFTSIPEQAVEWAFLIRRMILFMTGWRMAE